MLLAFAGCKKQSADLSDYDVSLAKWNSYKISVHNSYSFVIFSYAPLGINPDFAETKITVQNGVIIGRDYSNNSRHIYTETKTDLRSHTEGAEPITLDDVYTKAKNVWLKDDPSHGPGILETNNNGLISRCGYTITSAYNNFVGIEIKLITPL